MDCNEPFALNNLLQKLVNHLDNKGRSPSVDHHRFEKSEILRVFQLLLVVRFPVGVDVVGEVVELDVGEDPDDAAGALSRVKLVDVLVPVQSQVASHLAVEVFRKGGNAIPRPAVRVEKRIKPGELSEDLQSVREVRRTRAPGVENSVNVTRALLLNFRNLASCRQRTQGAQVNA